MSDLPVLSSRQANGIAPRAPQGPSDALIEKAKMLAASTDVLPRNYASKPGACMMLLDWCDRNDVSIFEGIAEVAIVSGKPVISAKMQKRLAARFGVRTKKIHADTESATVAVIGPDGEELGRSTYTIDMARAFGLLAKSKKSAERGGTDFWKADAPWMLTKRATTRALDEWGPDELVVFDEDAIDDHDQGVDILPPVDVAPSAEPVADVDADPAVDPWSGVAPTLNEVMDAATSKKLKPSALVAALNGMGYEVTAVGDVVDNPEALMDLADWVDQT